MTGYTEIKSCRVTKEQDLVTVLDVGHQKLTGVFPRPDQEVGVGTITTYGPYTSTQVGPYNTIPEVIGTMFPHVTVGDPFKMTGEVGTLTVTTS